MKEYGEAVESVLNKYGPWKAEERKETAKAACASHTRDMEMPVLDMRMPLRSRDRVNLALDILEQNPQVSVRGIAEIMQIAPSTITRRKQKLRKGKED